MRKSVAILGIVVLLAVWSVPAAALAATPLQTASGAEIAPLIRGPITTRDRGFVDNLGRQVLLHGINIGGMDQVGDRLEWRQTMDDFARLRQWGFNCVRMQIEWCHLEPECGKYREEYLRCLDQRIADARRNGLYVLLDMHQDLWSRKAGGYEGAPDWATLNDGKPHVGTPPVWGIAYYSSPSILAAFDSFWTNRTGPDGTGIQDRFALAWRHVAQRYANDPAILGYDFLNEPAAGSPMALAGRRMSEAIARLLAAEGKPVEHPETLWQDDRTRGEIYRLFGNVGAYQEFLGAGESVFQEFERGALETMYRRVAAAIREVDRNHILFIEPNIACGSGVVSGIRPLTDRNGRRDPAQAIAPHVYDLTTDNPSAPAPILDRVQLALRRLDELSRRLDLPMLIGEWGAFEGERRLMARGQVKEFERMLASETYWIVGKKTEQSTYFEMLRRPCAREVAGTLQSMAFDPETRRFECGWRQTLRAPSCFYVPATWYPQGYRVEVTSDRGVFRRKSFSKGPQDQYLTIPALSLSANRRLAIIPR